jgi:hypothetical protein
MEYLGLAAVFRASRGKIWIGGALTLGAFGESRRSRDTFLFGASVQQECSRCIEHT